MYENNTRLTLTLIAMPKHEQRENKPKRVFVTPITSHIEWSRKLTARCDHIQGVYSSFSADKESDQVGFSGRLDHICKYVIAILRF